MNFGKGNGAIVYREYEEQKSTSNENNVKKKPIKGTK